VYTPAALLDMHARGHRSLAGLIRHLGTMDAPLLKLDLPGFGFPTIMLQLTHAFLAEAYWIGVLQGRLPHTTDEPDLPDVANLEALRADTAAATRAYLESTVAADLNAPKDVRVWPDTPRTLVPAHIVVRTITHLFDHKGQVAAMCRTLGHPIPQGMDYPLT
jgi:uncharacterized damage-inducible protein DinB